MKNVSSHGFFCEAAAFHSCIVTAFGLQVLDRTCCIATALSWSWTTCTALFFGCWIQPLCFMVDWIETTKLKPWGCVPLITCHGIGSGPSPPCVWWIDMTMHWNSHDTSRNQVCCIWAPRASHHEIHEFFMNFEFFEVLPNTEDIALSADIGLFDIVDVIFLFYLASFKFRNFVGSCLPAFAGNAQEMYNYIAERPGGVTLEESSFWSQHSKNPWDTHLPPRGSQDLSAAGWPDKTQRTNMVHL